ncbi:MAG: outer membrane protein assembly factor BamD [Bacteroidota bacterium]
MKVIFYFTFLVLVLSSCSEYSRVLKGDDYTKKFSLANDLYERKKYMNSIALYEQVYQRLPKTAEGEVSFYRIGKGYYLTGDYYMGAYFLGSFFDKYPLSTKIEESFFLKTICSVKNSPQQSLDQQETEIAINDVQQFIYLFPNSSRIDTCNIIIDNLRLKLENKDFESIKLYSKTLNYKSAVTTAETFLNDYPTSRNKEEVIYIKIKNSYFLAKNSIDDKKKDRIDKTIETYRTFAVQFPESKHLKELETLNKSLQQQLDDLKNKSLF